MISRLLGYAVDWPATGQLLGAIIALIAISLTWLTHRQRVTFEMIDRLYSLCHTLEGLLMKEPRLSHLFCIGADDRSIYDDTVKRIAATIDGKPDADATRSELAIAERLFAVHTLIAFEQVYYHHKYCGAFNPSRKAFLESMLDYFCLRLLRNPRMIAYVLSSDLKGSHLHLEKESMGELTKRLKPHVAEADTVGPFRFDPVGPHEVARQFE
jgi:hypothetical protein